MMFLPAFENFYRNHLIRKVDPLPLILNHLSAVALAKEDQLSTINHQLHQ
jgi:hypothetical protein